MKKTVSLLIALIVFAFASIPVMAAPSPTASKEYKIIVHNNEGGTGSYTTKVDKDGKHATITAHPKKGYEFVKWTSKGKYKIIKGSLNDKELRILLQGDVEFTPHFRKIGTKSKSEPTKSTPKAPVKTNQSPVSPKTGDSSVFFIFGGLLAAALFTAVGIKLAMTK